MAIFSPSAKLLAVVHVGSVSGVVRSNCQTARQVPFNKYELDGAALDVCRQVVTQTAPTTEPYTFKVTRDAIDDQRGSFESLSLLQSLTCLTVSNQYDTPFCWFALLPPTKEEVHAFARACLSVC